MVPTVSVGGLVHSHLTAAAVGVVIGIYLGYRITRWHYKRKLEKVQ